MKIHTLKTWPEFFGDIAAGRKTFELRKDDRGFRVGDTLELREYDPKTDAYSGRMVFRGVEHILEHRPEAGCAATLGLRPGYVIMSLSARGGQTERFRASIFTEEQERAFKAQDALYDETMKTP